MVGVGHGRGGHSWAGSIPGLWASPPSPPPALPGLGGGRGHISAWPDVCPALVPLGGLGEAPYLPGRVSRLGDRGATLGPALAQGATEGQREDCVANGGCTYPGLALHDHGPQPRKLNSRGLAADLDHRSHCWWTGSSLAPPGDIIDLARWGLVWTLGWQVEVRGPSLSLLPQWEHGLGDPEP